MSLVMPTAGLSLDQAPPLSIPASFFLMIPLGILLAGCILLASGIASLTTPWAPQTISLAHAGTLGILAIGMMGALRLAWHTWCSCFWLPVWVDFCGACRVVQPLR
jgi:hypothetical protein